MTNEKKEELKAMVREWLPALKDACLRVCKILYVLYPALVLLTVAVLYPKFARAGQIRKLALSQESPGVINLAFGNATAISFQFKPEKLVPGSPHKVEINFLGKDITVSPLAQNPGNLLVFTDRGLYVLIFKIVPEARYDDRVEVVAPGVKSVRAIRPADDAYHIEKISVALTPTNKKERPKDLPFEVIAFSDRMTGDEFMDFLLTQKRLKCEQCVLNRSPDRALVCSKPMPKRVSCKSDGYRKIEIARLIP